MIDASELQHAISALELTQAFPNRTALWQALAQTGWARERGLSARALESLAGRRHVTLATPKGTGNRFVPAARAEPPFPAAPQPAGGSGQVSDRSPESGAAGPGPTAAPQPGGGPEPAPGRLGRSAGSRLALTLAPPADAEPAPHAPEAGGRPPGQLGTAADAEPADPAAPRTRKPALVDLLRHETPSRFRRLVDRVAAGSLRAAVDLKCLECSRWQPAEVRRCPVAACPLHPVRPYRP